MPNGLPPNSLFASEDQMTAIFFFLGLIVGSFLNVCAWRIPRHEGIVLGRSHCPHCGKDLAGWQLIPVFSFLVLKSRCAYCHQKISWRYPLIELANGLIYALLFRQIGLQAEIIPALFFSSLLLVISIIDYEHKIIPNTLLLVGTVCGIPLLYFSRVRTPAEMALGFLAGGVLLLAIAILSRGGMGAGDVKFCAVLGLFLGWQYTLQTVFLASILGSVVGLGLMAAKKATRKTALPFGPFLAVSAFVLYIWGLELNRFYWSLFS